MSNRTTLLVILVSTAAAFLVGYLVSGTGGKKSAAGGRKVLYYVDPMHPAYKSDKPGIAPDCGMQLEPVYADGLPANSSASGQAALPPGSVQIATDKQQLIGVRTATVEKAPASRTLRALGRVVPEDSRLFKINAAIEGIIKRTYPVSTGELVQRDQVLATFYTPEFFSALSILISTMDGMDRHLADPVAKKNNYRNQLTVRNAKNTLINLGMSETQLEHVMASRNTVEEIELRSPTTGFVLARNISYNQRFERGAELFRIADISKVWILADLYENEATLLRPGMTVRLQLPHQNRTMVSRVSQALPMVDPVSRTIRVRLEADNPGYVLRPDMFVNLEIPINLPDMISVPSEAVIDSGLRKTVFVDRGNGWFEPRQVETGRSLGERVEVVHGLKPGEKIVVSGNFLLDSESRLRQATAGIYGKAGRDPVCGMALDEDRAKAAGLTRNYNGKSFYFCSPEDMTKFDKAPAKYATATGPVEPMSTDHGAGDMSRNRGAGASPKSHNGGTGMPMAAPKASNAIGPEHEAPIEWKRDGMILMPGSSGPSRFMPGDKTLPDEQGDKKSPSQTGNATSGKPMKPANGETPKAAAPKQQPETPDEQYPEATGDPLEGMKSMTRPRNDK